ncbi:hypothetical protein YW7DRAFT_03772 [Streptomyces sp. AmelKG-E11A]|nr:hypothetical protein YW7DRAFT_03772 [Streptomyces sp. AmelKG-E11A]
MRGAVPVPWTPGREWPRSTAGGERGLLTRIRHLLEPHGFRRSYGALVADLRYLPEILPVKAMTRAHDDRRLGGDGRRLGAMTACGPSGRRPGPYWTR